MSKSTSHRVALTDKSCGLAVKETDLLTEQGIEEYLIKSKVYTILSEGETKAQLQGVEHLIESFASRWQENMTKTEYTYLRKGIKTYCGKLPNSTQK